MKTQNKCNRCEEETIMSVLLPIGELTETGKIDYPNETEYTSVQIPVPLCFKCMQFAEKRFLNLIKVPNSDKYELVQICDEEGNWSIEYFEEKYKTGELKKDIKESLDKVNLTKKDVKKQKMVSPLKVAIIIDEILDNFEEFKKGVEKERLKNDRNR